jgi:hypothetical protein
MIELRRQCAEARRAARALLRPHFAGGGKCGSITAHSASAVSLA